LQSRYVFSGSANRFFSDSVGLFPKKPAPISEVSPHNPSGNREMNIPDTAPVPSGFQQQEEILPVKVPLVRDLSRTYVDLRSGVSSRYKTCYPRINMPGPAN